MTDSNTIDRAEIKRTVLDLVRETLNLDPAPGDEELCAMLEEDIGEHLDSIKLFSLVVAIEDHFKICLEPDDDASITRLDDVIDVVERLLQETGMDAASD